MKVSYCRKCKYYKRCTWSSYYKPAGYHAIGVSHAYGFCTNYNKRCLQIKQCFVDLTGEYTIASINEER